MEIAEYSWREGHRHMAEQLLMAVYKKFPNIQQSRFQELAADIKEEEDEACAAFLHFVETMMDRSPDKLD